MNRDHKNLKNVIALISSVVLFMTIVPVIASAQGNPINNTTPPTYIPLSPLPCVAGNGGTGGCPNGAYPANTAIDFKTYVQYLFNLFIGLAAASAVFMIVFGGLQYMTTDSWQGKSAGLEKAKNAIYGLILVLASYLILRTIDPRLVNIPSTLVPALNINYTNSTNDLLNNVSNDAVYQSNLNNINSDIQSQKNSLSGLQTQQSSDINQICTTAGVTCNDPSVANDMCADNISSDDPIYETCQDLAEVNDTIKSTSDKIGFDTAKGEMLAVVQQCSQTADPNCAKTNNLAGQLNTIEQEYAYGSKISDPALQQQILSYGLYSNTELNIKAQIAAVNQVSTLTGAIGTIAQAGGIGSVPISYTADLNNQKAASIAAINSAVNAYASSAVADPATLAQLKADAQTTISNINAATLHACNNINC